MNYIKLFESFSKQYTDTAKDYEDRINKLNSEKLKVLRDLKDSYKRQIDEYLIEIIDTYKPNFQFIEKDRGKKIFHYEWRITNMRDIESITRELADFQKRVKSHFPTFRVTFGYSFKNKIETYITDRPQYSGNVDDMVTSFDKFIPNLNDLSSINFKVRVFLD